MGVSVELKVFLLICITHTENTPKYERHSNVFHSVSINHTTLKFNVLQHIYYITWQIILFNSRKILFSIYSHNI